jgi:hypothetical protein
VVARCVQAEVDGAGAAGDLFGEDRIGDITSDDLGARELAAAAPVDRDHLAALLNEVGNHLTAHLAGTEDHMAAQVALASLRVASSTGSATVSTVTVSAPLEPNTVY